MFLEQDSFVVAEDHGNGAAYRPHGSVATAASAASASPYIPAGGRYGAGGRAKLPGVALAVGVHLAIVPILLGLGYQAVAKPEHRFVAVNLTPPPPPPPAAAPDKPQQQKLDIRITPPPVPLMVPVVQPVPMAFADTVPVAQPATLSAPPAPPAPPSPPAAVSTITSDSLATRMVSGHPPRYPVESRRRKEQGTVELLLVLGTDGAVEAISIARSSGFPRLDDAALASVRRWRWQPTMRAGTPVKVKGVVEIPFVLKSA